MKHLKSVLDKPKGRRNAAVVAGSLVALTVVGLSAGPAFAHGSSDDPMSRVLGCKLAGVTDYPFGETEYEGCNVAYDISGEAPFANWQGIVVPDTRPGTGKDALYRTYMPDGQLCSAGNEKYAGLDAPSDDWPTTDLPGGDEYTLNYKNTVAHNPYTFSYYVTKDGYDPKQSLTWDDLEQTPFLVADNIEVITEANGMRTELPVLLPSKSGEHVVLTIWQGNVKADGSTQSDEAFIACSNVNFG